MSREEYLDAIEGVLLKNHDGKIVQENTLLQYRFTGGIKKRDSPRYKVYRDKINGRLVIDKYNQKSTFVVYIKHGDYDIRFQFSYELMNLILEIRNSMYDMSPVRNPFYNIKNSQINFDNLSYTPKLIEALTTKRMPLTNDNRKQILLNNTKEILAMKDKHTIDIAKFLKNDILKDEEVNNQ